MTMECILHTTFTDALEHISGTKAQTDKEGDIKIQLAEYSH